ncbi:hypothetical protein [Bdellovibrio sp. NC01]|uniref:hypothetical protein n=1 Tax=Bdellovibrio sp. NC01 TaxID=2220073 RepID=UPI001159E87C|nr:hypothetical protein [Bdellovibrio sp. NC01]QDK39416.1 hypothetical protein DOE51_18350 [Bdellovibrio sp. NC01]
MMKFLFGFVLLFSTTSFANTWYDRGNGGFVLSCQGQAPQVLDLYEATTRFGLTTVAAEGDNEVAKASALIGRLAAKDPQRASTLQTWLNGFLQEAQFVDGSFARTPDLGLVLIPDSCSLDQTIVQQQPSVVNKFRYLINKKLWNSLDADNKAALIVHELIYREFISTPSQEFSSERIRYFNAFIHANLPGINTVQDYVARLQDLHIGHFQYNGLMLFLGSTNANGEWISAIVGFDNDQNIVQANLFAFQMINRPYFTYSCMEKDVTPNLGKITLNAKGELLSFDADPAFVPTFSCALPEFEYSHNDAKFEVTGTRWMFGAGEMPTLVAGAPATRNIEITYGSNVFQSPSYPELFPTRQNTLFRFDEKMNLVEIGLGGSPCKRPSDGAISFLPNHLQQTLTVSIDQAGRATHVPACY